MRIGSIILTLNLFIHSLMYRKGGGGEFEVALIEDGMQWG